MARDKQPLVQRLVDRLTCGEIARDSDLLGFGVVAEGRDKIYFFESAIGGQARRYRIGAHGAPWTPDTARAEAWRLKSELIRRVDAGSGRRGRRITEGLVTALKPGRIIWDGEIKGLGVRCQRAAKVYFLKVRIQGRQRWITIGRHGDPWTTEQARREAARLLEEIADGKPLEGTPAAKAERLTVAALCDLYLEQGIAGKKSSTVTADRSRIERHIKPLLGRKRASRVSRAEVERFLADVAEGRTAAAPRGGPRGRAMVTGGSGTAYRSVGLLSAIFNFAIERKLCGENPARGIRPPRGEAGSGTLEAGDLERLAGAVQETRSAQPELAALICFLVWSDLRLTEALALRWTDLDPGRGFARLPAGPNEAAFVPLCAAAFAALRGLRHGEGRIFPEAATGDRQGRLNRFWKDLRQRAGFDELRLQDLKGSLPRLGPEALEDAWAAAAPAGAELRAVPASGLAAAE